ncbi:MAG: hypothetical protein WBC44_02255 [Planctomycetaceae bacterium]
MLRKLLLPAQAAPAPESSDLTSLIWFAVALFFPLLIVAYMVWVVRYAKTRRRVNEDYVERLLAHMQRNEEQLDRITTALDEITAAVKANASKP